MSKAGRWWRQQSRQRFDLFREDFVRAWVRLERDMGFECVEEPSVIGSEPRWFWEEMGDVGLPTLMDVGYMTESVERWALENGIAPGQSFLMHIDRPHHYSYQTQEGTEYDSEYGAELLQVAPLSPQKAAKRWERYFKDKREAQEARAKERARRETLARTDLSALELHGDLYWTERWWDEMQRPQGVRLTLRSRHTGNLASGESNTGDWQEAHRQLWEKAQAVVPTLTREMLDKMPRRW